METFAGSKLSQKIDKILGTPTMISSSIRCTGYRPILDAFKKFGSDAPGAKERVAALVADIEDLGLGGDSGICKRTGKVKIISIQDCQSCQVVNLAKKPS